jgi:hypothetical protein
MPIDSSYILMAAVFMLGHKDYVGEETSIEN